MDGSVLLVWTRFPLSGPRDLPRGPRQKRPNNKANSPGATLSSRFSSPFVVSLSVPLDAAVPQSELQ